MKAIRYHNFGPPEVLQLEEMPTPMPGDGEMRIRIHAAGVNPVDWKIRSGAAGPLVPVEFPCIPGTEIAGEIDALGSGVQGWALGDAVICYTGMWGGYAEYVCVAASIVARKPSNVSFADAGGMPLCALTAWGALTDAANVQSGQRILIVGGAGAVGSFAIQIAKRLGADVVATSSSANRARVLALGADESLAYDLPEADRGIRPVDFVLDCVGSEAALQLLPLLKPDGLYVALSYPSDADAVSATRRRAAFYGVAPNGDRLDALARRIERGELRLSTPIEFPLADAAKAQLLSHSGHAPSRIVLTVA